MMQLKLYFPKFYTSCYYYHGCCNNNYSTFFESFILPSAWPFYKWPNNITVCSALHHLTRSRHNEILQHTGKHPKESLNLLLSPKKKNSKNNLPTQPRHKNSKRHRSHVTCNCKSVPRQSLITDHNVFYESIVTCRVVKWTTDGVWSGPTNGLCTHCKTPHYYSSRSVLHCIKQTSASYRMHAHGDFQPHKGKTNKIITTEVKMLHQSLDWWCEGPWTFHTNFSLKDLGLMHSV